MNVLGLGGIGDGALQHGYQLLWIRRLVADAHRHDHLVIAIDGCLAVVALQQVAVAFHEVAAWIRVVPLRSGCGTAIGPMGQAAMGHRVNCLRLQPLGLKACLLGLLDRQIFGGFCFVLSLGCLASQLLLPA